MDVGPAVGRALETPLIVEIFERSLDVIDADRVGLCFPTRLVKRSLNALKPTTRSATVSVSLDERTRTATTHGRKSS